MNFENPSIYSPFAVLDQGENVGDDTIIFVPT